MPIDRLREQGLPIEDLGAIEGVGDIYHLNNLGIGNT